MFAAAGPASPLPAPPAILGICKIKKMCTPTHMRTRPSSSPLQRYFNGTNVGDDFQVRGESLSLPLSLPPSLPPSLPLSLSLSLPLSPSLSSHAHAHAHARAHTRNTHTQTQTWKCSSRGCCRWDTSVISL